MEKKKSSQALPTGSVQSDMFFRAVINKEKNIMVENIRQRAPISSNPLIRAIHLDPTMGGSTMHHTLGQSNKSSTLKKTLDINFLDDKGGGLLFTRGTLPTSVHGDYSLLPTATDWIEAEVKQRQLQQELDSLDRKIVEKEREMENKKMANVALTKSAAFQLSASRPSVIGSSFKFHSIGDKSTSGADFHWPEDTLQRVKMKNTQYGLCTKTCDVPGGNLNINHEVRKNRKI